MRRIFKFLYWNIHVILTVGILIYCIVPFLSPILFHFGFDRPGWWIQTIYRLFCHQRPERSLFLFGEKLTYTIDELRKSGNSSSIIGFPFIGNEDIGYKVAFCVRDTGIYWSMALAGIFVSLFNRKVTIQGWMLILATIPIAIDGITQFISEFLYLTQNRWGLDLASPFYLSNNTTRAVTGALFGIVVGLFVFSELKSSVRDEDPFES